MASEIQAGDGPADIGMPFRRQAPERGWRGRAGRSDRQHRPEAFRCIACVAAPPRSRNHAAAERQKMLQVVSETVRSPGGFVGRGDAAEAV